MAESWIKMRGSLLTNPKVIRMARALLVDPEFLEWFGVTQRHVSVTARHETVTAERDDSVTQRHAQYVTVVTRIVTGSLLPTWSQVRESATDEHVLHGAGLFEIDTIAGVPGFGRAMQSVGWIVILPNEEGVKFTNFGEHNSASKERSIGAKTQADRARDYRERKKLRDAGSTVTETADRHVTERDASRDAVTTEKSREEKKNTDTSAAKLPTCPAQAIVDLYCEVLPELPQVRLMTEKRKKAIAGFWRFVLTSIKSDGTRRAQTADQALTWIRNYFGRARDNDFLMGRTPRAGEHANWQCDLDFLLTDRGKTHVIEKTKEIA